MTADDRSAYVRGNPRLAQVPCRLLTQAKDRVSALELIRQFGVNHHIARTFTHKLLKAMLLD